MNRRHFLQRTGTLGLAIGLPSIAGAAPEPPIADAHSHIGLHNPSMLRGSLKAQMLDAGVTLLSWNISGDGRWIARTSQGIKQQGVPASGAQGAYYSGKLSEMRAYLAGDGLRFVEGPADIDAAMAGSPRVVIAVEGAVFVADGLDLLDKAYADGLRHVQLVHYIRNALGDFQTESPEHGGMTQLGVDTIKACNRLGILVDLAHATEPVVDKALEVSTTPIIWSHSSITSARYTWTQGSNLSRLLYIDYAKKIAQRGGAVGLWSLRNTVKSSPEGYADELMRMADVIGPEHVMFGTDMDGVGKFGVMDSLGDLRSVADLLKKRGVDDTTLRSICFGNYARCLRTAIEGRKG
ncbi:MAG TPA: membrane dipeptidase [Usitatibacter sp.]|nr:membrane dipeptidase [Usitatibacter sp.]